MWRRLGWFGLGVWAAACAPAPTVPRAIASPARTPRNATNATGSTNATNATSAVVELPAPSATPNQPPEAEECVDAASPDRIEYDIEHIDDAPVTSLASGKAERIAVLVGANARLYSDGHWIPIEPALDRGSDAHLSIFFGRDNEPRVMGWVGEGASVRARYLRRQQGRWVDGSSELGGLARLAGKLYGVLGHDDPEVVCVAAQSCLVKRLTGWTSVSAHPEPAHIAVSGGRVWALFDARIDEQSDRAWVQLEPPRAWDHPDAVWFDPDGSLWVVESRHDAIWRRDGHEWRRIRAPVHRPRAIWGPVHDDVWIGGDGGVAHFDGAGWHCAHAIRGPISFVLGTRSTGWFAGQQGVWRAHAHGSSAGKATTTSLR